MQDGGGSEWSDAQCASEHGPGLVQLILPVAPGMRARAGKTDVRGDLEFTESADKCCGACA